MHTVSPLSEEVEVTADARVYRKTVESEAVKAMCGTLASLAISEPVVADSLKSIGLDAVAEAAHKVQDTASDMLLRWLRLEEVLLLKMMKRNLMMSLQFQLNSHQIG